MVNASTTFPVAPEDLTPEWVTSVLRDSGAIKRARVTSLTWERIGEGVGFLGQIARVTPTYDLEIDGAPQTLIGKFPTPVESAREMAAMYGVYRCEVNFYQHLADEVSLRTPRCYFSAISDDGTMFALLLEDLGAAGKMGDQVGGCSLDEARLAIREVARFHAFWWDHPRLPGLTWLPLGTELGRISMARAYPAGWETCLKKFGHLLTPAQRGAVPGLNERILAMLDDLDETPLTIMHADYRLDNMFFGGHGAGYEFAVIDWQITNRGWALYDVAYFLGTNLDSALRRAHEITLLREYHDTLTAARTRGGEYSWEQCHTDYVRSMAVLFATMVGNVASLDMTNERGVALFDLIIGRAANAVEDLQSLDAVP